jgi:hypothetical protein
VSIGLLSNQHNKNALSITLNSAYNNLNRNINYFGNKLVKMVNWISNKVTMSVQIVAEALVDQGLSNIARRYGTYQCNDAAEKMSDYLKSLNLNGAIVILQFSGHSYVVSDLKNKTISTNGFHAGVLYKGNVYCNVHPYGLPIQLWINDFHGYGTVNIKMIPF